MRGAMGHGHRMMGPLRDPRSRFFMALASDQRLKILAMMKEGEKNSTEITEALGLDPSVISRHLMLLREVGAVSARKEGVVMYFKIADTRVIQLIDLGTEIIKGWLDRHWEFFK